MKTSKILAFMTLLISLVMAACTSPGTANQPLKDSAWLLATLNGQAVLPGTPVTLAFKDGGIGGTDGCNSYSSSYTESGAKISIDPNIMSTMMACPDPIMQQASGYITALTQAAAYKSDNQSLTLLDAGGKTLATFTRQSSDLGGTSWIVTGYNNGKQAVVSVLTGTDLTAAFNTGGQVSGTAGCNSYSGTFEVSGTGIKISQLVSTEMACADPAGVMDQEAQFLQALGTAATYQVSGSQLELRTADGALAVTLVKAP